MSEMQKFVNEQLGCALNVIDLEGKFFFIGKEAAHALKYKDTDQAIRVNCKHSKTYPVQDTGQVRNVKIIPESDLYRLIANSQKPEAEPFKDWVFEEVIPSIRKHGAYMTQKVAQQAYDNPESIVALARRILEDANQIDFLKRRDAIFGNRTPFGNISHETGLPRTLPVRGYLRSNSRGYEFVPDAIQLSLFNNEIEG